jgi:hypothetical protein
VAKWQTATLETEFFGQRLSARRAANGPQRRSNRLGRPTTDATSRGNVVLFRGLGNQLRLRGLLGGAEGIRTSDVFDFARYSSPGPKGPSFSRSLEFASASLLRELLFEAGVIGSLYRYWRRDLPSLARLANLFDEEFPHAPKLKDFVFEGSSSWP